ncbi:3-methyl-2-oxobutanoate hydroxymethyltransferase [Verrucomicrobiaceae bacterium N1E253]|uniref:3-methyl-2-oxobutanoate hydroxymethyltransferase n=1 Tax=Oceaniferula marina TaxID=2748318 RepID=A0A851GAJ6_9BACT|nr:3-methyl-2-oxobutanoate hydroxymethyltransferase [Oceaniferula marina]NWK54643.1 3-methyl-2-oxobutanoate hydroxymethyltransferase [Oceaniferula marina]
MNSIDKAAAITARKGNGKPISALTAYDYPSARLLDEAGVDVLLVGDSLGMVMLGFPDTTHVTLEMMLHHVAAVSRAVNHALVIGDMPIHTYNTPEQALATAKALVEAGADAVKLEGGVRQVDKVKTIVAAGIPVIGHHGMLPQRVLEEGGYKKKGKTEEECQAILEGALALQDAGCSALVLESVVPDLAETITSQLDIPTIGIGCTNKEKPKTCDGEIAVITDVIGSSPWFVPPFATTRANVAGEITRCAKEYIASLSQA